MRKMVFLIMVVVALLGVVCNNKGSLTDLSSGEYPLKPELPPFDNDQSTDEQLQEEAFAKEIAQAPEEASLKDIRKAVTIHKERNWVIPEDLRKRGIDLHLIYVGEMLIFAPEPEVVNNLDVLLEEIDFYGERTEEQQQLYLDIRVYLDTLQNLYAASRTEFASNFSKAMQNNESTKGDSALAIGPDATTLEVLTGLSQKDAEALALDPATHKNLIKYGFKHIVVTSKTPVIEVKAAYNLWPRY